MSEFDGIPVVQLPGYEGWAGAYEWGHALTEQFPGQDADEFAYACESNDPGPAGSGQIVAFEMVQQGERDESEWAWRVSFVDGTTWMAEGGCDFTGWDCRSHLLWTQEPTP